MLLRSFSCGRLARLAWEWHSRSHQDDVFHSTYSMMQHPYQCLLYCSRSDHNEAGVLVAASGPYIHTFSAQHGTHLSTWPSNQDFKQSTQKAKGTEAGSELIEDQSSSHEDSHRPQKRRKLSPPRDDSGSSAEIVVNGGNANGQNSNLKQASNPPVIKLAGTSTGQYVVAVTGEDKCLRVFELSENGCLKPLSER